MEELSKKINVQNKVKIARQGAKPKYCNVSGFLKTEILFICLSVFDNR